MLKKMLLLALALFFPAMLFAATIQLPETGQTSCYDSVGNVIGCAGTGQDGEIRAGVAWPNPRFVDNSDQTITDNLTGLMWTKDANAPGPAVCSPGLTKNWLGAIDYINCLNSNSYLGFTDWRLPNILELRSLQNTEASDGAAWLNTNGFLNVAGVWPSYYWSSTATFWHDGAYYPPPDTAYIYNAMDAQVGGGNKPSYLGVDFIYVWPTRLAGQGSVGIPQTGQENCYDEWGSTIPCAGTGQDGEIQAGADWPNPRFVDNGDQTISDNLTDLIWTKNGNSPGPAACSPGATKSWQESLDYVKCLNTNGYLGFNDWRLPNLNELYSLVNFQAIDNGAWLADQGFISIRQDSYGLYWTATTLPDPVGGLHEAAYMVMLNNTGLTGSYKSAGGYYQAIAVRTGPYSGPQITYTLSITVGGTGTGVVHSDPLPDINCTTGTCQQNYTSSTLVTLTAVPNSGQTFDRWAGVCTGVVGNTCQVTMNTGISVEARFKKK